MKGMPSKGNICKRLGQTWAYLNVNRDLEDWERWKIGDITNGLRPLIIGS